MMTKRCLSTPLYFAAGLFFCAAADHAHAQVSTSPSLRRGLASTWPAGLSIAARAVPFGGENQMILKKANPSLNPTEYYTVVADSPDYRLSKMFPGLHDIDVDAHSSGNGVIPPLDDYGNLVSLGSTTPWVAIVASVSIESMGTPTSNIRRAVNNRTHAGGELIGYYLDGSGGINVALPGHNLFESTRPSMNFQGVGPMNTLDIDALDYAIGAFASGIKPGADPFFTRGGLYYFSLSKAWCDANPTKKFDGLDPDPRTVYSMQWFNGAWTAPAIFVSSSMLGLPVGADLDAIDIDLTNQTIIYSADLLSVPTLNQVMFAQYGYPNTAMEVINGPYPMPGGINSNSVASVSVGLGTENGSGDDVRALCGIDPESSTISRNVGIARQALNEQNPMGMSVVRTINEEGANTLTLHATGWGSGSAMPSALHFTKFEVRFMAPWEDSSSTPTNDWAQIAIVPRQFIDDEVYFQHGINAFDPNDIQRVFLRATNFSLLNGNLAMNGQTWNTEIQL